uniref:Uncharacterized protein n=1 Tax=Rhizophora mucronata TaxID=61149 RepID=A0A2P2NGB6_RHIMU
MVELSDSGWQKRGQGLFCESFRGTSYMDEVSRISLPQ